MAERSPASQTAPRKRASSNEAEAIVAMMNKSIDAARLQFKRVRKDLDNFHKFVGSDAGIRVFDGDVGHENVSQSSEVRIALFADVHFLLISMHETEQLFARLKKLFPLDSDLSNLNNRHRPMIRRCSDFRVHMEHVDGKQTEDLGRLSESLFTLRGKAIDLGPTFEKEAEALFADLVSAWARISERQRRIRELIVRGQPAT